MRHSTKMSASQEKGLTTLRGPRHRALPLVGALVMLGSASVLLDSVVFRGVHEESTLAFVPPNDLLVAAEHKAVVEATAAIVLSHEYSPAPMTPPPTQPPTPTPPPTFTSAIERMCYYERGLGMLSELEKSRRDFCQQPSDESDPTQRTGVTFFDLEPRGNIQMRAMIFHRDFQFDLSKARIRQPIVSLSQDGGGHDPRFLWTQNMISCGCREFQQFAQEFYINTRNRTMLRPWEPTIADTYERYEDPSTVCGKSTEAPEYRATTPLPSRSAPPFVIEEKTVIMTRRDDHNPFFQVSSAMNAWLMMRVLGWRRDETRLIHLDGGFPSPIDDLHYRLVSTPGKFKLLHGSDLIGHTLRFTNQVLIAPYETTGPLMQHLNDEEYCGHSELITEFRAAALEAMGQPSTPREKKQITITIISRRDYGGRRVQRKWLNEDVVVQAMQQEYPSFNGLPIVIQSIDFVDLTLEQQMNITLHSDVVIGMHGAGMVNVLWTQPKTLVIEIFPRRRYRWGYRNICKYIGCDWHEYRGGQDTGFGDNASDKRIQVYEWLDFFDPLFRQHIGMPPKPTPASIGQQANPVPRHLLRLGNSEPAI